MPEFIEQFSTYYGFIISRILIFLLVLTGLWLSGKYALIPLLDGFLSRRDMDKHTRKPLLSLTRFFVFIVGAGIAFGVAGFNNFFTSLVAIGTAGTLAIGFALQSVLKEGFYEAIYPVVQDTGIAKEGLSRKRKVVVLL